MAVLLLLDSADPVPGANSRYHSHASLGVEDDHEDAVPREQDRDINVYPGPNVPEIVRLAVCTYGDSGPV